MNDKLPSHLQIALKSIEIFVDDGTIDLAELNFLLGLAMRDGKIDDEEKRVLESIFDRVDEARVEPRVWERIQNVRRNYATPDNIT